MPIPVIGFGLAGIAAMLRGVIVQLLIGLGVSLVTYKGVDITLDLLIDKMEQHLLRVPQPVLDLFALAGLGEVLNIYIGAFSLIVGTKAASKSLQFLGKK